MLSISPGCLRCLYEIDGKFIPPSLQTRMGKWCILDLRGVIHDVFFLGGGGVVFRVCCFIFHDSVRDCSSMGSSYNPMIFWLKINIPGSADELSQLIDNACCIIICFSNLTILNRFVVLSTSQLTYLLTFRF